MANMYDVAKRAGVSIATVSAVVNGTAFVSPKLTARVRAVIDELDYTVNHLAHSLQTRRTKTVGMLVPAAGSPDPFYGEVVRGAEDILRGQGYMLILGHTYNRVDEQSRYLAAFRSRFVDGVLLFQAPGEDEELDRLLRERRALVFVGRIPQGLDADVVATDIALGTRLGIEHLTAKGHRRIGLLVVESSLSVGERRREGWKQALQAAGVEADETLVAAGRLDAESGLEAMRRLLELPEPPTAVFADNLVLATVALRALAERGLRCPQEVAIVSSDDAEWLDVFTPPVTTIVQPGYRLGAEAAQLLLERIEQPGRAPRTVILKPTLRPRPAA